MGRAYLTIDDGPTEITDKILDYLLDIGITPVLFFVGTQVELNYSQAINAVRRGAFIGNHSYSHADFNKLTESECIIEIEKQEMILEKLYHDAGYERKYKLFRFPYGHRGGENEVRLQEFLYYKKFNRIDDRKISYKWYIDGGYNRAMDVYWTFDFQEYRLNTEKEFTLDTIKDSIHVSTDVATSGLLLPNSYDIVLMHDSVKTNEVLPDYYKILIEYTRNRGVTYMNPCFLTRNNVPLNCYFYS
ncbi:MAG: polysaccharide deacetylase family protein [Lachnospiraceae bacterium]|nr:polysaccharide deacetylase family protein [Lachnospiraceae bacterium]